MVILSSLVVPAAAAVWLMTAGRGLSHRAVNLVSTAASLVTLGFVLLAVLMRPTVDRSWVPAIGVRWELAVDGISAPLLLLTALLGVAVVVHTKDLSPVGGTSAAFHACLLLVELGALATFYARDAVLFFIAFEVVLVPMWVLITRFGDAHSPARRTDAGGQVAHAGRRLAADQDRWAARRQNRSAYVRHEHGDHGTNMHVTHAGSGLRH